MNHTRHMDIFDVANLSILLIGAGGIGAITGLTLAKMGIRYLSIVDDDVVVEENLSTQFHKVSDVGMLKVHALAGVLYDFSDDLLLYCVPARVTCKDIYRARIAISAVDSINARKEIWQAMKQSQVEWYIDARMGAEILTIYTVSMENTSWYESILASEDDSTTPDLPCTAKATIYTGAVAGGLIGKTVRQIVMNGDAPRVLNLAMDTDNLVVVR